MHLTSLTVQKLRVTNYPPLINALEALIEDKIFAFECAFSVR
jgi:hypothetical protein